jgi:nitrogen regulatory protein PII 2
MKEIMAIIRMNKVNPTKKALSDIGINSFNACKVLGRGKMVNVFSVMDELTDHEEVAGKIAEGLAQGSRLIPKRCLSIVVKDEEVTDIVNTIIKVNQERHSGDGKIFLLPIMDVIRVRTGETGIEAL